MAVVNALAHELVLKIVYYGPGQSGKTTTLQHLHATTRPEHRGKMVSLATPVDRTLYFDFLPIRLPRVRGMGVRLQLFTVPGQVYYNATRKLVLTGADGLVFVSDSQADRTDANLESLDNLRENLREHGRALPDFPHVVQHHKRDAGDVLAIHELDRMLNGHRAPSFGTVAPRAIGVYEALEAIARRVVSAFEASIPLGAERTLTGELEAIEGGLTEALRGLDPSHEGEAPSVIESLTIPPAAGSPGVPSSVPSRSDRGAEAPGEVAARVLLERAPQPAFTTAGLWPESDRDEVRAIEAAIADGLYARAVELCDALVARVLASAAGLFGSRDAPRDAAAVPWLLGVDGRQYLAFRATVRDARAGRAMDGYRALEALVFAAQARILRSTL